MASISFLFSKKIENIDGMLKSKSFMLQSNCGTILQKPAYILNCIAAFKTRLKKEYLLTV